MKRERYSYSEILDDVTRYFTKIQTNEYLETGLFPIIDQGKEFITGYTNSSIGIYNDYPIIIFGDHTRIFKYIDFPCYLGADGVKALKNIKPDKINSKYLYYYLKNSYIPDTGYNRHFKWVKELFFNIHDIQTQKEIVSILDKVTSLISMRKEQLEKLDILVKSKFIEMFGDPVLNPKGWEKKKLGEVCDVRDGTHDSPKFRFTGYPLVTSKNIVNNQLVLDKVNYISQDDYDKINKRSKVDKGDILLPMIGTIGNPVVINIEPNFAIKNVALIKFNNPNITNTYIYNILTSNYIEYVKNILSRGGTQKFIALADIRKLIIPIPPLDIQNQFAEFVEQVEKNKENIKSSLNQLETLYNVLMQEYFG